MEDRGWRSPRRGTCKLEIRSLIWISMLFLNFHVTNSIPDPEVCQINLFGSICTIYTFKAYHGLSIEEYDSFLQELHPPHPPRYDVNLARAKRQAGEQTYEFDSDEEEEGTWDDWGPPSSCSR